MSLKRVVVGFPGDCRRYVDILAKILDSLNHTMAEPWGGFTMRLYRWDEDAYPGFHAVGPQGIIDDVLKIQDADLFVNFFYARLGTPDPNLGGRTGTEHEFEQAYSACVQAGRPKLFLYFHKEPLAPRGKEAIAKFARLDEFRESLQGRNVFRWDFTDETIEELLRKHVSAAIREWVPASTPLAAGFDIDAYRRAFSIAPRWDLAKVGVAQAPGDRRIDTNLGDIFQPLRVHENGDPSKRDLGEPLTPDGVLALSRGLVLQGAAGSGKTTWMRHTHHQLIRREDALPFLIELRSLRPATSFLGYLRQLLASRDCKAEGLEALFQGKGPARPVLLIDGWDELGDLGRTVREHLMGFLANHPRVIAVVTSRPYGDQPPSSSDGFETRRFQPLNDAEIERFSADFWRVCYGADPSHQEYAERFRESLAASEGARELARNPLMMTMMLIISRSHRLPDRRHRLYDLVVRNLLATLRREEQGVLAPADTWRPESEEDRLRAVAELAFAMQSGSGQWNGQIELAWTGVEKLLPGRFIPEEKRAHFLRWLAGPCGLMTDKSDGKLSFVHLSFQEYLAARHIYTDLTGSPERFPEWADKVIWWETLRLWAALQWDNAQGALEPVLEKLAETPGGIWLTGCMMADGTATPDQFDRWKERAVEALRRSWEGSTERAAKALMASAEHRGRLRAFEKVLHRATEDWTWVAWWRASEWCQETGLDPPPAGPVTLLMRAALQETSEPSHVALGRLWRGSDPAFPGTPWELALLNAWPSRRALESLRLQGAASLLLANEPCTTVPAWFAIQDVDEDLARYLARYYAQHFARDFARCFAHYLARYLARNFAWHLARDPVRDSWRNLERTLAKNLARDFAQNLPQNLAGDFAQNLARDFARDLARWFARNFVGAFARGWARDLVRDLGLNPENASHVDFAQLELLSANRALARVRLATLERDPDLPPAVTLLAEACRASLDEQPRRPELRRCLDTFRGDPLWPALARHLARVSDERDALTKAALNWESYPAPLSWGLRYLAKGDVLLPDLTSHWHVDWLEQLPIVDPMEPELRVDWDKEES